MRRTMISLLLAATLGLALTLAACGGEGQDGESTGSIEEGPVAGADVPELAVAEAREPTGLLRWQMTRLNGEKDDLSQYAGKVVLVVNTASECGFTPQFEGLQGLYEEKKADGLVILGFPSNDFAGQEPRSNEEIASFCKANFGVEFPMFAKSAVTGDAANPLFAGLPAPEWNFSKYLLDRNGELVANWGSATEPDDPELLAAIDAEL